MTALETAEQFADVMSGVIVHEQRAPLVRARDAAIALAAKAEAFAEVVAFLNRRIASHRKGVSMRDARDLAIDEVLAKYTTTEPAQEAPRRAKCHLPDCACGSCMGWAKEPHPSTCGCQTCWGVSDPTEPAAEPTAQLPIAIGSKWVRPGETETLCEVTRNAKGKVRFKPLVGAWLQQEYEFKESTFLSEFVPARTVEPAAELRETE